MSLTPEQQQALASWVAAGDNLSTIQKKLSDEFKISLTYRDVRFLVDDLDLALKDPAPKVDASDVTKPQASAPGAATVPPDRSGPPSRPAGEKKGFFDKAKEKLGLAKDEPGAAGEAAEPPPGQDEFADDEALEDLPPAGASNVSVSVDKVTLIPGALASGEVTFSDGVKGKWIVDQYGRPGLTELSQPGYRPSQAEAQAFMQELARTLQRRGY
ncbi:hypothetical protein [Opitutus terrae]|uniref:Uncharacterized protein n=1 Tax=Opitutus terrae (strain DSM 11246 / JCM 15787 / PB90-1) TaxID=452637 RepID=B1ZWH0_OPITP|nr:hypothetical protein [Opitutus terrae]ACB73294.1 hypothetical protein Oter_0002 [Opitutus terrae PB90-1]